MSNYYLVARWVDEGSSREFQAYEFFFGADKHTPVTPLPFTAFAESMRIQIKVFESGSNAVPIYEVELPYRSNFNKRIVGLVDCSRLVLGKTYYITAAFSSTGGYLQGAPQDRWISGGTYVWADGQAMIHSTMSIGGNLFRYQ